MCVMSMLYCLQAAEVETGQALYARRMYFMKDFQFNHQFVVSSFLPSSC